MSEPAGDHELVEVASSDGVTRVRLNRPEVRNAISRDLIERLMAVVEGIRADREVRVVVLEGSGKSFCAGMDLKQVMDDPVAMGDMLRELGRATIALRSIQVPTIFFFWGS